ncbi:MAG: aldo/keto reductase [Oscillospiraceae bacterium]|nr:aldo/keto reductase [Oscillospiraceae bacterium]
MKSLSDSYTLSNGVKIPCVGFGTWQTPDGPTAVAAVKEAIAAGYRHIDTAQMYENESSVGRAVRESDLPRSELFITSKLANPEHGYDETMAAFEGTMRRLEMDYLDLFLVHWPNPAATRERWREANAGTWRAFEELYAAGRVRAIGVSNFRSHHFNALFETARLTPQVNQILLCPGETQDGVRAYCDERGILLEAYSPLGTGRALGDPTLASVAAKYGKTPAQICINWCLRRGWLPLPKSVTPARIRENADVFDFELSDDDADVIASVDLGIKAMDPDTMPF